MKYFSSFSGIGGFELGIQQAYVEKLNRKKDGGSQTNTEADDEKQERLVAEACQELNAERGRFGEHFDFHPARPEPPVCVGYSEIDRYAIQIYEKHFSHTNFGDITKIDPATLPDFDLVCGGFPCQSFSIAGKRGGFNDTRGTLFFDIARIVRVKRPKILFLENVKGLLSHDGGRTFDTIIRTLDGLGYDLEWQVLNSKNFGVPQNRERVFIIGHFRGTGGRKVFPIGESDKKIIELRRQQVGVITGRRGTAQSDGDYIVESERKALQEITKNQSQGYRVYDPQGISSTLAGEAGGIRAKMGLYAIPVLTPNRPTKRQNGRRFKENGEPSFTLTGQDIHGVMLSPTIRAEHHNTADVHFIPQGIRIRRLTPKECERLQGFPDGWTEGISDTQRYKCLGNAVTVNVIKAIAEKLF